jgi:transcriptional regulator with XRE-family HTH domain
VPWVPKADELRRLRERLAWSAELLAHKAGVSDRAIRAIESERPPRTMRASTVAALAKALGSPPEALATWVGRASHVGAAASPSATTAAPAAASATATAAVAAAAGGAAADGAAASAGLPTSTLAQHARLERQLGGHARRVSTPSGDHPLLGPDRLNRLYTHFLDYEGDRFAVVGRIEDHRGMPPPAAVVLGASVGRGARFLMTRAVTAAVPFYATVFAVDGKHTRRLMRHYDDETTATVIARVVVAEPRGDWKGFFIFEKRPRPWPWALVVDEVV